MPACAALGVKSSPTVICGGLRRLVVTAAAGDDDGQKHEESPHRRRTVTGKAARLRCRAPTTEQEDHQWPQRQCPSPPIAGPPPTSPSSSAPFALVFFITMVVSLYIEQAPQGLPQPFIDWSVIGLVHVFVLFMLIQTLALVCGAHFNPAVTVGAHRDPPDQADRRGDLHRRPARRRHARRADDEGLPLGRGQPGELRRGRDLAAARRRDLLGRRSGSRRSARSS